jgi:hypothetical protein
MHIRAPLALLFTLAVNNVFAQAPTCPCATPAGATKMLSSGAGRSLLYTAPITHVGNQPRSTPGLKQGGNGSLLVAFQRILPSGWNVWEGTITEPLPQNISWPSGKPWFDALGDALLVNNLRADVDWSSKSVVLHTQRLMSSAGTQTQSPYQQAATTTIEAAVRAPATTWQIRQSDASLRAALERWGKAAEWTVIYEGQNYAFESTGEFEGEFMGAVCKVLESINESIAESEAPNSKDGKRFNAGFWRGNSTVRIFEAQPDSRVNAPESCSKPTVTPRKPAGAPAIAPIQANAGVS